MGLCLLSRLPYLVLIQYDERDSKDVVVPGQPPMLRSEEGTAVILGPTLVMLGRGALWWARIWIAVRCALSWVVWASPGLKTVKFWVLAHALEKEGVRMG
jgi:hypothetical protein